ncbi:MAG: LysM domain-containing protein [Methylococcaceae bacterium]|nr:MAG: LysM domain-containing protein [Methylococcaceae bacterium]
MNIRITLIGLLTLTIGTGAMAEKKELVLNPQHPEQYVVAQGDTLWDVAGKFLKDPWLWPELWAAGDGSTRILHPGDVLRLSQVDGKPRLLLNDPGTAPRRRGGALPVVKLSPKVRATDISGEIPVIPLSTIRAFLSSPKVVEESTLDNAPYLLALADGRSVAGTGEKIYVQGVDAADQSAYGLFHKGKPFLDGDSGDELGYEAIQVADVSLLQEGDPAIFQINHAFREVKAGDRLLPLDDERVPSRYEPHAPDVELKGHIVGIMGDAPHVGHYSVVVVDKGGNDGLEVGHVLDVTRNNRVVPDTRSNNPYEEITLPPEVVGNLLIFRTFERVSFGLIMKASLGLTVGDVVQTP